MAATRRSYELVWIATTVIGLLALFVTVVYFRSDRDAAAQLAFKTRRLELVNAMRLAIAAASEAQNGAVMSTGEHDSQSFAAQAHTATAAWEGAWAELLELQRTRADLHEDKFTERVAQAFREFRQVDEQLLDVAVQNSNRRAYDLAFGPATKTLQAMDEALARVVADQAKSTAEDRIQMLQAANEARIGVLRIQTLLLPHIAEASDQKMDELEARMSKEETLVGEKLATLRATLPPADPDHVVEAATSFTEFTELKTRILKLSRENTDVRSVALALNEKRKAMLACEDALAALEETIRAEPLKSTIPSGR